MFNSARRGWEGFLSMVILRFELESAAMVECEEVGTCTIVRMKENGKIAVFYKRIIRRLYIYITLFSQKIIIIKIYGWYF